jgi:hypothetical protein
MTCGVCPENSARDQMLGPRVGDRLVLSSIVSPALQDANRGSLGRG